jgi:septum formation protein
MKIFDKKIILASKSPRRSQLLSEAGFSFEIKTKDVEESYPAEMPVRDVAPFLAEKKAMASIELVQNDEILLAADSVVILGNQIFEKPKDVDDAKRILRQLSGKVHQVITGVCLISKKEKRVFSGVSDVHFQALTEEEIDYYITNYQPFDKAGSYGIQEWIGHCKILKIEGTYSNIMGLPMELVFRNLAEMG